MREARTLVLKGSGWRDLNALRRIHIGAPRQISPCVICGVLLIVETLGRIVRIGNPIPLLVPEEFGSEWGST